MNEISFKTLVLFSVCFGFCSSLKYDNFTLYNVVPYEREHLKFLQNIENDKNLDIIFWKKPHKLYHDVQFLVDPVESALFLERVQHYKIKAELLQPDIQRAFNDQKPSKIYSRLRVEEYAFDQYHDLEDIYQWLSDIILKYADIASLETIGRSVEGREIYAINIKRSPGSKIKVVVEGGIHGCEWMSPSFVTYLIHQLLVPENSSISMLKKLANDYNWFLIPVLNPDGYDYTHKVDRLWRKNRRILSGGVGVDLNRNFEYSFGKYDSNSDPKDERYVGPAAFSEPESQALANFISKRRENLKFYFSIHAYGQLILIPYADRVQHVENFSEMENFAKQAIMKMYKKNGKKYQIGTTYDTMGLRISGTSDSWVKKKYKIPYVFTLMLRDNGTYGLALHPREIVPACEEALVGIIQLMTSQPKYTLVQFDNGHSKGFITTLYAILILLPVLVILK